MTARMCASRVPRLSHDAPMRLWLEVAPGRDELAGRRAEPVGRCAGPERDEDDAGAHLSSNGDAPCFDSGNRRA
jgi:hypothetical protein